jgi:hypothetical protein
MVYRNLKADFRAYGPEIRTAKSAENPEKNDCKKACGCKGPVTPQMVFLNKQISVKTGAFHTVGDAFRE